MDKRIIRYTIEEINDIELMFCGFIGIYRGDNIGKIL
jgi:hypothetical protein